MLGEFSQDTPQQLQCSRAKCAETASFALHWRNPNIHTDGRTKTWLACSEHHDYLQTFLATRNFLLDVSEIDSAKVSLNDR